MCAISCSVDDGELRVTVAPEVAIRRIEGALNQKVKRVLGLKVDREYVGVVDGRRFEVWDRSRHAVHMLGTVTGEHGGSRIALESALTRRARFFIGLFLVVLTALVVGMSLPAERAPSTITPVAGALAVIASVGTFYAAARLQRAALRRFVQRVVEDAPGR